MTVLKNQRTFIVNQSIHINVVVNINKILFFFPFACKSPMNELNKKVKAVTMKLVDIWRGANCNDTLGGESGEEEVQ